MDQGAKGKMYSSDSNLLDVRSPRKPSEATSVDSGYSGGPSRETSSSLIRINSGLPIIGEEFGGVRKEFARSSSCMSSSFASIAEQDDHAAVSSEASPGRLHFIGTPDYQRSRVASTEASQPSVMQFVNTPNYQRVASIEASQPSIIHFNESHFPLSLTLSSSGSPSQLHIMVTSSGESQSQPENCNKSVAKSRHSARMTVEQEDILRRTVVKKTHLFTEHTNFVTLLPYLYEKKLLHTSECENMEKLLSHQEKGNHFYTTILPRKGKHAYRRLYKCLNKETKHLGHKDLVEILDKALEEQQSPQSSSESTPTTENGYSDHVADEGTSHILLSDSSNPPSTLKPDVNSLSSDDTLIGDRRHCLSCKCSGVSPMAVVHLPSDPPPCIHNRPSHPSNGEGKRDPVATEAPSSLNTRSHKTSNGNEQTKHGCCTIL